MDRLVVKLRNTYESNRKQTFIRSGKALIKYNYLIRVLGGVINVK